MSICEKCPKKDSCWIEPKIAIKDCTGYNTDYQHKRPIVLNEKRCNTCSMPRKYNKKGGWSCFGCSIDKKHWSKKDVNQYRQFR